mmetsp:Transcript_37916/g.63775  ORF Transcript_37916/g.63775 Transcript_37916/m.63775 type:complete len:260 (+) Transcript_37916:958-1737(+)
MNASSRTSSWWSAFGNWRAKCAMCPSRVCPSRVRMCVRGSLTGTSLISNGPSGAEQGRLLGPCFSLSSRSENSGFWMNARCTLVSRMTAFTILNIMLSISARCLSWLRSGIMVCSAYSMAMAGVLSTMTSSSSLSMSELESVRLEPFGGGANISLICNVFLLLLCGTSCIACWNAFSISSLDISATGHTSSPTIADQSSSILNLVSRLESGVRFTAASVYATELLDAAAAVAAAITDPTFEPRFCIMVYDESRRIAARS